MEKSIFFGKKIAAKVINIKGMLLLFTLFLLGSLRAQDFVKTDHGVQLLHGKLSIELEVYNPEVIRVVKRPAAIKTFRKKSLSVIKSPAKKTRFWVKKQGQVLMLVTDSLIAKLGIDDGCLSFYDRKNRALFTEQKRGTFFTKNHGVDEGTFRVKQAFLLKSDEAIYGLGQQQNGHLSQREQKVHLVQGNTKVSIPLFQSTRGYGLFWDNYSPTEFVDSAGITSFTSSVAKSIDYYFMKGNSTDEIIAQIRFLTGTAPMWPLWAFGYNQSKERYKTQFELLDVVKKYRKLKVPLDGIIQDWQYWGDNAHWNAMAFDSVTYPRPQLMVDSVHKLNAHLFIVAWPGFGPATKQYKEFKKKNMLLHFDTWPPKSGAKVYDVYNPAARDIYWSYLKKGLFSLGVDAWWLDSSEPDHLNEKPSDFDEPTYLGTYRSVRNAFPLEHIRGIYTHQRKVTDKKRVVILTRSAFAGQQRYGANTWSGDVHSDWGTFARQIPAGLNFSLTGLPYWNTDIGGFFANEFVKGGGAKNPAFQELYTRWLQFGTFMPMMRSHGTNIAREIYQFGKKGDRIFDVIGKFINLRYHLLPYIYATAWGVTNKGGSFMRPLEADFKNDSLVSNIGNEYLFGSSILVTPVTRPGANFQKVYLPAGRDWYDFWTGEMQKGGRFVKKATPIDIMPLYIKAGSIIPWGPKVQYATQKKWDDLEIRVYPGADATFVLYEDENDNYNYQKGSFSEITFTWHDATHQLVIGDRKGHFKAMLQSRRFNIVVVDNNPNIGTGVKLSKKYNQSVRYDGHELNIHLD